MSNKILIEVYVPLIEKEFDVLVPVNKKIRNVTRLINSTIKDLSNGSWPDNKKVRLFNRINGLLLESKLNVKDAGLINGSQVVLI